jgi:hypothetical protein
VQYCGGRNMYGTAWCAAPLSGSFGTSPRLPKPTFRDPVRVLTQEAFHIRVAGTHDTQACS